MRQLRHCISPGFFSPTDMAITPLYPIRQLRHCISPGSFSPGSFNPGSNVKNTKKKGFFFITSYKLQVTSYKF